MNETFTSIFAQIPYHGFLYALVILIFGFILARLLTAGALKLFGARLDKHQQVLVRRTVFYVVLILFIFAALQQLGFKLTALLGAAGIFSVALGFASQTSASNIISGLFLFFERAFAIGDIIKVNGNTGEVVSIDLLSTKLRTFDNLYVRVPNESMIKSDVINYSHFPVRRFDFHVGVAYKENIEKVRNELMQVAENNELCLKSPAPMLYINGFGDSSIDLQFSVWGRKESFFAMRFSFQEEIKIAFDKAGIEIPFPQREIRILNPEKS